jgi:nitroimidazol reductase NimA-like FMN-containing flavoprotein (pyridoxamine 5'-phosphate oxidase superfamily)
VSPATEGLLIWGPNGPPRRDLGPQRSQSRRTRLEKQNGRDERALRTLTPVECFDLLGTGGVGRVAFTSAAGQIMVLPVNFAMTGQTVIFRTAPDTLLALHAEAKVSFETDRVDDTRREGWSVLVHGHAHQVTDEHAVQNIESRTHLQPWAAGARDVYVRIAPTQISGRRISASPQADR